MVTDLVMLTILRITVVVTCQDSSITLMIVTIQSQRNTQEPHVPTRMVVREHLTQAVIVRLLNNPQYFVKTPTVMDLEEMSIP